jgi:hypothetical protein
MYSLRGIACMYEICIDTHHYQSINVTTAGVQALWIVLKKNEL